MTTNKGYINYKMFDRIKDVKKSLSLVYYIIYTIHLACISFLMIASLLPEMQVSGIFFKDVVDIILSRYLTPDIKNVFAYGSIGISVAVMVLFIIRLKLQSSYDEIQEYEKINNVLFVFSFALWVIFELIVYIAMNGFADSIRSKGFFVFAAQSAIPILVYTYGNYYLQTLSLYSYFTVPVILVMTVLDSIYSHLAVIAVSVYLLLVTKELVKKIYFGIVALIVLFVLKNQHVLKDLDGSETQIPFFYLGLIIISIPILLYKSRSRLSIEHVEDTIEKCYDILNQLKSEIPYTELRFHEFYDLYHTVVNLALSNKEEKSSDAEKILQKEHSKMTKKDFYLLLECFLDKECKKSSQSNTLMQIKRLKIRMRLQHSMEETTAEMFALTEELERSDKKNSHQFYQLFDQIVKKFAIFNNEIMHPAYIVYLNKLHENFEQKTHEIMDKMTQFWKEISQDELMRTNMDSKFDEVMKLESDLEKNYKKMHQLENFSTQKNAIDIIRTVFNVYEDEQKTISPTSKKMTEQSEINYSFIILENNMIKFISKDLLKTLGERGSLTYQNAQKRALFGDDFTVIIDGLMKDMNTTTQSEWSIMPIICKQGFIELKKIRILWYPTLQSRNRTLIQIGSNEQLSSEAYLIYHFKSDTIKYFNSKFISAFEIDKDKFHFQMTNYQFFFNELFVNTDVPIEDIKTYMKEDSVIRCKMYLKGYVERGILAAIPVEVTVLKVIQIDQKPAYCILKVTKAKDKKMAGLASNPDNTIQSKKGSKINIGSKSHSPNQNLLAKKYQNQKFFCRIPNNYQSKITQKQAQLQESGRWVYRYIIHILFGLIFSTVMVLWVMDYTFLQDRITSYRKEMVAIENTSEQYALLYQAYSLAIKRYYIQQYPEQTQLVKGKPAFVYDQMYEMAEQSFLNEFLRRYLTQINQPPNNNIDYNISFTYFSITTDTSKSTLMDFAEHIKRNLATPELDFLLKNYNNLRNLTIRYEDEFTYQKTVQQIVASSQIYYWVLVISTVASVTAILYVLWKIEAAIEVVYSLIELISVDQLKESKAIFDQKKKRILNVFLPPTTDQAAEAAKANESSSASLSDAVSSDKNSSNTDVKALIKDEITPRKRGSQRFNQVQLNQNDITEKKTLLEKERWNPKEESKRKLIDESLMLKLNRKSFFVAILVALNVIFYIDYNALNNQKIGILQFFDIKKDLYVSLLHVKREEVDAPLRPTLFSYFNNTVTNFDEYHTSSLNLVVEVSKSLFFRDITQFGQTARLALQSNMCQISGVYAQRSLLPCQQYLNGIVTKGFGQTFDLYIENAKKIAKQNLSDFGTYPCTAEKCPPYYQHEFVSVLMGETLRSVIFNLNTETDRVFEVLVNSTKLKIIYKILGMLTTLVVYFFCDRSLRNRCKKAIKYFRIIPKDIMCGIKLTTFIRKYKVLSKLDIL